MTKEKPENVKKMNILDKHRTVHPMEDAESIVLYPWEMGYPVGPKRIIRLIQPDMVH